MFEKAAQAIDAIAPEAGFIETRTPLCSDARSPRQSGGLPLELAGHRLDLADVAQPLYIVAAVNDHIVPWQSSYATIDYGSGPVRFVLCNGGHIAGVVNPPNPKAWYMTSDTSAVTPEVWCAGAEKRTGSWWDDWSVWSAERGGALVEPPPVGSADHRVVGKGPGEYVRLP